MENVANSQKKRKILIFSVAYYPYLVGGAEVAVKEITDRLGESFDFDMVTLYVGDTKIERIGNINVYRVGPKLNNDRNSGAKISHFYKVIYIVLALFKAISLHRQKRYDLTWSIMASFGGFSALFFKYIYKNVLFLLTLQEGDSVSHIQNAFGITSIISKLLYKNIFKKADFIQVISNFLGQYAKDMGAFCKIEVIPNAVDYKLFSAEQSQGHINALRSELGINDSDKVIITTSRLVPKNAVNDIIDSLTFLPSEFKLLILGTGVQEKFLKEKVKLLKLEDRVIFAGFVPHKDIPLYLSISNVFVRPSLSEGFGNSFIEAMASGIPVVATKVGGIVDFLIDGKTGLYANVKDPKSIAEKVLYIEEKKDIRNEIVKNAREMVKEKYDWTIISKDMKDKVFNKI